MILLTPPDRFSSLATELTAAKRTIVALQDQQATLTNGMNSLGIDSALADQRLEQTIASLQQTVTTNNETFVEVANGLNAKLSEPKSIFTPFNAGVWVKFGTLQFTIPTSGNRSLQVRSVAGNVDIRLSTSLNWDSNNTALVSATVTPTSNLYMKAEWNFGGVGNYQRAIVEDVTNTKIYSLYLAIGASYQNNVLVCSDIT
jgi:hypothetical protein